jgi:hydrogenase maturation protease
LIVPDSESVLCIGVGNEYRSDDGVGVCVARALREMNLPDVFIVEHSGEGFSLAEKLSEADKVILIDAVSSGAAPGTLFSFAAHQSPLPTSYFSASTHAFGVAEAIELARQFGELPTSCIVYGVEGANFEHGVGLSPALAPRVHDIALILVAVIEELQHDR